MSTFADWGTAIKSAGEDLIQGIGAFLPRLLGALLLLLAGWLIAKLVCALVIKGARLLDKGLRKLPLKGLAERPETSTSATRILGRFAYWGVLLLFLIAAVQVLAVEGVSSWLARLSMYLPSMVAGGLAIIVGVLLSGVVRDLISAAAPLREKQQRATLGRIAQALVICASVLVGAEQIGIEVTFLIILTAIVVASFLGSLALGLGLGAKTYFSNLLGAQEVRRAYQIGQTVKAGEYSGVILDITSTSVILENSFGRVTLPARTFCEEPSVLVIEQEQPHDE